MASDLLVDRQDVKALTNALAKLIESKELRQRLGEAGKIKFHQDFTRERMINETRVVYQLVLEKVKHSKSYRQFIKYENSSS